MSYLSNQYRLTQIKYRKKIPSGIDGFLYRMYGRYKSRSFLSRELIKQAEIVQLSSLQWQDLSEEDLQKKLVNYKALVRRKASHDDETLFEALGILHEASFRALGMRPYPVQTAGALALLKGYVAEMATGEGKTLTASLAAIIHGWSSRPCHIVTANDYLAERDAAKLEQLYNYCGLSVGYVISTMKPLERKNGYAADITYSTAKEVTADFLRDRIALGKYQNFERRLIKDVFQGHLANDDIVMRGLHTAIIDEADSLLIDEAATPLIISQQQENEDLNTACYSTSEVAKNLVVDRDYTINIEYKDVQINSTVDFDSLFKDVKIPKQFSGSGFRHELLRQALVAREFFHCNKQYVIQDEKIVIVDEFTGRIMPQRSWSDGLHQMVEAKEGVPITPPNETLARISFQRFFRFYQNLSGMTGTASEAKGELWQVYDLPVVAIPRNRPCQRNTYPTRIFKTSEEKWNAIIDEIALINQSGRPVLVGTLSVEASETLAAMLHKRGLRCEVINAIRHNEEANIISRAGVYGAITVATNMAGRGTDIILDQKSLEQGGLHVIATEFHETARIDRQLYGRSGRQGDKGSDRTFASMDDQLLQHHINPLTNKIITTLFILKNPVVEKIAQKLIRLAQGKAQKKAASSRNSIQKMDLWLDDSLSFTQKEVH